MTKREQKKQLIIDTAFKVWGDNFFYNTSLSSLADAMDISKAAIYRYFSNKEALIIAMKENLISKYQSLLRKSGKKEFTDLNSILFDYTEYSIRFFAENYNYYRFIFLKLFSREQNLTKLLEEMKGSEDHFAEPILFESIGLKKIDALSLSGYIQSLGGFLLNQKLFSKKSFTSSEINQMTKIIRFISQYGLGGSRNVASSTNYNAIEMASTICKEDILPYDRIFTAIADVIAEKGVWETTIDSIAEKLEMSKSSLYFYFENKDQMIKDVIERETEHLNSLIMERVVQFKSYKEQIYCIFHVMSSYFILKPSIFSIMNWLRFQFINKPVKAKEYKFEKFTEYIGILTKTTSFNPLNFPPGLIAKGLNFILIRELWECVNKGKNTKTINIRLRKIHGLIMNGYKGSWK